MSMKNKVKKHSIVRKDLLGLLVLLLIIGGIYSHFGGFGTGPCASDEEFRKYVTMIDELKIPKEPRMIALGEATHGNAEFRKLKFEVFKKAVAQEVYPTVVSMVYDVSEKKVYWCENRKWDQIRTKEFRR